MVDRKDLDYQTMKEYDRFEKGAANSNTSTAVLKRQLEDSKAHIIITTIQKLATFIKKNPVHKVYDKHVVIIFDDVRIEDEAASAISEHTSEGANTKAARKGIFRLDGTRVNVGALTKGLYIIDGRKTVVK